MKSCSLLYQSNGANHFTICQVLLRIGFSLSFRQRSGYVRSHYDRLFRERWNISHNALWLQQWVCASLWLKGNQVWWSSCWDAAQGQKQNTEEIGSSKKHVHMITWLPNVSLYLFVIRKERRSSKWADLVVIASLWECSSFRPQSDLSARNKNTFKTIRN